MKKLLNNPESVVEEMVSGYLKAHSGLVKGLESNARSIVKTDAGSKDKVSVIIGGGSGHEPAFMGYVGTGMADGAAVGNIFSSPPPDPVVEAARATHTGSGVLLLYGNYQGDIMNFGMAVDMLDMDHDIEAREIVVKDDIASASKEEAERRRGIAGEFFVTKTAGAAAEEGFSFDDVQRLTEKANRNVASMGVGLSPCSLPQTGKPSFVLERNEIEIGLGHHGEPGVEKAELTTSRDVTERILNDIINDMELTQGEEVSVLINGLGSTTRMELYIMYDEVESLLQQKGITIYTSYVGDYCTSMEMGGCSISLLRMDEELKPLLDAPAQCPMYTQS